MASFKELPPDFIDEKYEGGVKVILESEEDVRIFCEHWFPQFQDKIRFESAEGGQKGGGGCMAVLRKVKETRDQQLLAFGIVDRDILLADAKLDMFWETSDLAFHEARPYGEEIHVLCRWELENYLLQPEAFSAELACRVSRSPAPRISVETLLIHENDLVDVTALTVFMIVKGLEAPKPGFAQESMGENLRKAITEHLKHKLPQGGDYDNLYGEIEKIRAFFEQEQTPIRRWSCMNRILDGKKALNRICCHLSRAYGVKGLALSEEMRGCLANRIASEKLVDKELVGVIERFYMVGRN